jgi:hypothetical protein
MRPHTMSSIVAVALRPSRQAHSCSRLPTRFLAPGTRTSVPRNGWTAGSRTLHHGPAARGGRRDTCPALRKRLGYPVPTRGGCATANEDSGWRIEEGKARPGANSCARTGNPAWNAQFSDVAPRRATAGLKTGKRGCWVAGNRRRMGIRGPDAVGLANHVAGAGGGPCLGRWRSVLWYQGMSRVAPEWYKAGKGVQTTFLSIANAYATQAEGTKSRRQNAKCEMRTGRVKPPKATPKLPHRAEGGRQDRRVSDICTGSRRGGDTAPYPTTSAK